jgi:hypothetical protein
VASDPDRTADRLSAGYLIALAARAVREVGRLELLGESRAIGRCGEVHFGVEGQGREALLLCARPPRQPPDLAHGPRRESDQVAGRQPVGGAIGIARHRPEGVGR